MNHYQNLKLYKRKALALTESSRFTSLIDKNTRNQVLLEINYVEVHDSIVLYYAETQHDCIVFVKIYKKSLIL
jgi:hypothetical protein